MNTSSSRLVLVGTDLSDSAKEAIRQAAAWAGRTGATLLVVHVAPDQVMQALEIPRVSDALGRWIDSLLGDSSVKVELVIEAGSPHATLVRVAGERRASLVVVGAGHGGVGSALFGTTAEQVVRHAHCPVLIARASPPSGPVVAATDFSEDATFAFRVAAEEARRRKAPLHPVHSVFEPTSPLSVLGPLVVSPPELPATERQELQAAAEETMRTLLEAESVPGTPHAPFGDPATTVPALAQQLGASLVVVGTRGRTALSRIAVGSVAEAIARRAPCSVLAVRSDATGAK